MDPAVRMLMDQQEVIEVVTRLFVATDGRDWKGVEACLADAVVLDMTSLAGGEPARLTPSQVAGGWRDGLARIDHVHHQIGNFLVRISGDEANVNCYGVAWHHRAIPNPDNVRTFVGTYDVHLRRTADEWRIDLFRFNNRFVSGNMRLESAT
jgi:hypothetical protein